MVLEALQEVRFVDLGDEAIAALQKELAAQGQPCSPALPPFSSSLPLVAHHTTVAPQVPLSSTLHCVIPHPCTTKFTCLSMAHMHDCAVLVPNHTA